MSAKYSGCCRGFTTIELLVTMAFFAIIFSLISFNISGLIPKENLDQSVAAMISDLRMQQLKAMLGDEELAVATSPYGVHIETNKYVLFKGSSYIPGPEAVTVTLPPNITIQNIPNDLQNVVFSSITGEITLTSGPEAELTIADSITNRSTVITINSLGVVYED